MRYARDGPPEASTSACGIGYESLGRPQPVVSSVGSVVPGGLTGSQALWTSLVTHVRVEGIIPKIPDRERIGKSNGLFHWAAQQVRRQDCGILVPRLDRAT